MIVYKTRDNRGIHIGTDMKTSGWASAKYWYVKGFKGDDICFCFGDSLTDIVLFDHPLHSWDEKTW